MPPVPVRTFKNSNTPNSIRKRPKPTIEEIKLTEEDKNTIKEIIAGRPPEKVIKRWQREGVSISNATKYYNPPSLEGRLNFIRQKYFKGLCYICRRFPLYKVTYKMSGVRLLEYYCQECFSKDIVK